MIALAEDLGQRRASDVRGTDATRPGSAGTASSLVCIGVSHRTAPVALRERLAVSNEAVGSLLSRFGCCAEDRRGEVSELVVLSTCNRLELYASGAENAADSLLKLISEVTGVPAAELKPSVYRLSGADAVIHLCRTAAGLDSMVLGEPQILGQVSAAFATAVGQRAAGHALSTLFRGAIRVGRRARAETGINRHPATVSSAAVALVTSVISRMSDARVLIVGAGEMAELAAQAFQQRGVSELCVISRSVEHAARLGDRLEARAASLEHLPQELAGADVVIASTAAPHHIITRPMIQAAMAFRPDRPLAIVDIALPRNVDPDVRGIARVNCWDLDDLQRNVAATQLEREAEIPQVERVVEEEAERCLNDLRQLDVQPLIADLRAHLESVRRTTLERAMRGLSDLTDSERRHIEVFSQSLVNRLFHEPTTRLRHEAEQGQAAGYAMAMRHLFGLER
jgi:glutamyl-tRNA reductase